MCIIPNKLHFPTWSRHQKPAGAWWNFPNGCWNIQSILEVQFVGTSVGATEYSLSVQSFPPKVKE